MDKKIKVMVVDDNSLLRLGLIESINCEDDMISVAEAENGAVALERYREFLPDVVTMDYQMPNMTGIEATRKIVNEFPNAKIILLSVFEGEEDIGSAVDAGAKGYLTKTEEIEEVLDAIREVFDGGRYFPAKIAKRLDERSSRETLTAREMEVLRLIVDGFSNKEIMSKLNITQGTVKLHVSHVLDKLDAADRTQAAIIAVRRGFVHLDD